MKDNNKREPKKDVYPASSDNKAGALVNGNDFAEDLAPKLFICQMLLGRLGAAYLSE